MMGVLRRERFLCQAEAAPWEVTQKIAPDLRPHLIDFFGIIGLIKPCEADAAMLLLLRLLLDKIRRTSDAKFGGGILDNYGLTSSERRPYTSHIHFQIGEGAKGFFVPLHIKAKIAVIVSA